jgi:hypothetical protein
MNTNNDYAIVRNALDVARNSYGCKQAHVGVLRHMVSLTHTTLGTNAAADIASTSAIEFDYNRFTKQVNAPSEILKAEADGFIATHLRLSIIKRLTGATVLVEQQLPQYWANPRVFTSATQATRLSQIYNGGSLIFEVAGNKWNKEGLAAKAFERIQLLNQGLEIVADTADETLPATAQDGLFDGAFPLVPGFMFGGKQSNKAIIQLARAVSFADTDTNTTEYIAVLETIGVYCPNVSLQLDEQNLPSL